MYPGYLGLGGYQFDLPQFELINNARAMAYIDWWNKRVTSGFQEGCCINWVNDCSECRGSERFWSERGVRFDQRDGYMSPVQDSAPWYRPSDFDTAKFLGVIGLEVTGVEDSIRSASVQNAISGGGVVGRLRLEPREMVVRAVVIGADTSGLNAGLEWLREQSRGLTDDLSPDCEGDSMWFLDSCPPCAEDSYYEPSGQVLPGTPDPEDCLKPYLRKFTGVRVIQGPLILNNYAMSCGAMAEIEMTLVAPDPAKYGEPTPIRALTPVQGQPTQHTDQPITTHMPDPINAALGHHPAPAPTGRVSLPTTWTRLKDDPTPQLPAGRSRLSYEVLATEDYSDVRIEIVDKTTGEVLDGFEVPFLITGQAVHIDGMDRSVYSQQQGNPISGYVRDFDGFPAHRWRTVTGPREIEVIVDYVGTHAAGSIEVSVEATPMGAG